MECKLLLFDLDGTLLKSDKTISARTLSVLNACRERGVLIGVSTSRSEQNSMAFLSELQPDVLISSGGALVKQNSDYIYKAEFSAKETNDMIRIIREVCGADCEITVDTLENHYWNYRVDPKQQDQSWGDSIYTDFADFHRASLKICAEIFDADKAEKLRNVLTDCDCVRFSDGCWYKLTKKGVTKEKAITEICRVCKITPENIIAFGDDLVDIGMLKLCGVGVAMGNAVQDVKEIADVVIGANDDDGIADYLAERMELMSKNFPQEAQEIMNQRFCCDTLIALATTEENVPHVRAVNSYYEDGAFYVITYALSNKMKQIEKNPTVAICGEWFTAHGVGENLGYICDEKNREIADKLRAVFAEWYDNGHVNEDDPNTCILCVHLTEGVLFSNGTRYDIVFGM